MKKSIIVALIITAINAFAQPSNVASLTDVKESVHYLIMDYKDMKNKLEQSESRIKVLEESLNKKSSDEKNSSQKNKRNSANNGTEDQIILDYLNQNKNN